MGMLEIEVQFVHQTGHQGQLFRGTDGAAYADRFIRGGLLPGLNVLQGLGQLELFKRSVENDLKPVA